MINIQDKHNCCGCSACVQVCSKHCISFEEDEQGFRYPLVDESLCINCNLCEKVCPVINQSESSNPLKVYAAIHLDEQIRMQSSSGGIFTLLAESVIKEGGVVFGARFNANWEVEHAYTDTLDGLAAFRGSKYLQSCIGETYHQARQFLKSGRKVMFTGTSCQIAGLKKFLRKEYDNLFTVDVVCHGVPSPLVWRTYLNQLTLQLNGHTDQKTNVVPFKERMSFTDISFRDKSTGWKNFSFLLRVQSNFCVSENTVSSSEPLLRGETTVVHEVFGKNLFMKVFLSNLCLRPSCYTCPAKCGKSGADLSLGDFWGIGNHFPEWDDDKGTSLVILYTAKGFDFFHNQTSLTFAEQTYDAALQGNPSIEHSVNETRFVNIFWQTFHQSQLKHVHKLLLEMKPKFFKKILSNVKSILINRLIH